MSWREALRDRAADAASKRITVGFDGFVDTIVRPLRQSAAEGRAAQPFSTIREFGEFLIEKAEKSCSIELQTEARQLGGNLPYLSRAAGGLGLSVTCIGMLGVPIDPLFAGMPCKLFSFSLPGQSTCMEFSDGKVLLAADCTLPDDAWRCVLEATENQAPALFQTADLIALVNWSELSFAHGLWEHTLESVRAAACDKSRYAYFDLCDITRRSTEALDAVLRIIGGFAACRTAILSLNENEALVTAARLLDGLQDPAAIAQALRARYQIDEVLIHTIRKTVLVTPRGVTEQPTHFVAQPCISTGAGDNFNGASCFAAVMGLCDEDRVAFANAFAHFYVSQGRNPTLEELF